jgi:integrase
MPRKAKSARLYLRKRPGRESVWVILDRGNEIGTGCGEEHVEQAEAALRAYLQEKYQPAGCSDPAKTLVADILNFYMREKVEHVARPDVILYRMSFLLEWWGTKSAIEIKPKACRDYVSWRKEQIGPRGRVSEGTARKDLESLRAALRFYHEEYTLTALPVVKLPEKPKRREDWLNRDGAARLIWAAWRNPEARHLARFILIGVYSGTRPGAILRLKWLPSTDSGWIDLENGRLYRKGGAEKETKKRQPPAPIHARLLPHLRRWQRLDAARKDENGEALPPAINAVHHNGKRVQKLRRSWRTACKAAKLPAAFVPHSLRHTAATWQMQAGTDLWEAAGYLGMSVETLQRYYGHHHPDFQAGAARAEPPRKRPRNEGLERERKANR